ncbi:hypothetical protein FNF28_03802 [Cafeteria roenbergensis]|uniref:Uncharacterized protein n=1 Tax=Cafeteria roenbergensis TaxID=33653 RepID=A0A5A8DKQ6_CAFRO|nr:hypothetical protein FNF28_03802 [Cafeteria roenbergensis]
MQRALERIQRVLEDPGARRVLEERVQSGQPRPKSRAHAQQRKEQAYRHMLATGGQFLLLGASAQRLQGALEFGRLAVSEQRALQSAVGVITLAWRRCAERLRMRMRRRKDQRQLNQAANLIVRFARDHSGLAVGMNVVMRKYRRKVIHVQRMWRSFSLVTEARIQMLRSVWEELVEEEHSALLRLCANQLAADKRVGRQSELATVVREHAGRVSRLLRMRKTGRWRRVMALTKVATRMRFLPAKMQAAALEAAAAAKRSKEARYRGGAGTNVEGDDDYDDEGPGGEEDEDEDEDEEELIARSRARRSAQHLVPVARPPVEGLRRGETTQQMAARIHAADSAMTSDVSAIESGTTPRLVEDEVVEVVDKDGTRRSRQPSTAAPGKSESKASQALFLAMDAPAERVMEAAKLLHALDTSRDGNSSTSGIISPKMAADLAGPASAMPEDGDTSGGSGSDGDDGDSEQADSEDGIALALARSDTAAVAGVLADLHNTREGAGHGPGAAHQPPEPGQPAGGSFLTLALTPRQDRGAGPSDHEQPPAIQVDMSEAAEVRAKITAHLVRDWRLRALPKATRAALQAMDKAKTMTAKLRWSEDEVLPAFVPLMVQRLRLGKRTGGGSAALLSAKEEPLNHRWRVSETSLPLEYRPVRPTAALSNALLHAHVMYQRWEHKLAVLPSWRAAERLRQRDLLTFSADDIVAAIKKGPEALARFTAGRYLQAIHSTGRPPPLLLGLRKRAELKNSLRPYVQQAMEMTQLNRFIEVLEQRQQARSKRTSIVQAAAQLRGAVAQAAEDTDTD